MTFTSKTLLSALAGAATVAAHGHVTNIIINGLSFQNYDPFSFPYQQNPPKVVGWTASNTDNGFVGPESFASPDIICHKSATNAGGHAVVAAGDKIFIQWDTWPDSHHGPVIDYLANCGSAGCETVDKTTLEFFKIDEVGLIDGTTAPGVWGSDQLIANGNAWLVQIPSTIAPGNYVLRHEIIALHSANNLNGAQNYPQCFNLQITGAGTATPQGTLGTKLYTATDAGILANIYNPPLTYTIPGPALIAGASSIPQAKSTATASATAVTGNAAVPAPTATSSANSNGGGATLVVSDAPATTTTTTAATAAVTTAATATATSAAASTTVAAGVTATATATATSSPIRCGGKKRRHARDVRAN